MVWHGWSSIKIATYLDLDPDHGRIPFQDWHFRTHTNSLEGLHENFQISSFDPSSGPTHNHAECYKHNNNTDFQLTSFLPIPHFGFDVSSWTARWEKKTPTIIMVRSIRSRKDFLEFTAVIWNATLKSEFKLRKSEKLCHPWVWDLESCLICQRWVKVVDCLNCHYCH